MKKRQKLKKLLLSEKIFRRLCLVPSLGGVLVFFLLPFCVIVYYSFLDNVYNKGFVGLKNYTSIIGNSAFQAAARNTFVFSLTAVPLAIAFSLILAMILDSKIHFVSQFRTSFLCPLMVPVASVVLIWEAIFHFNGAANHFLERLNPILERLDLILPWSVNRIEQIDWMKSQYGMVVYVLLFLWKNLGYNMILFLSALNNIPVDLLEVATLEGAGGLYKFIKIKLKYLSPTILFVGLLSLINSFKMFREIFLLTGSHPFTSIYLLQHYMYNVFESIDYQRLSSAAMLMSIVMVIFIGLLFIAENKFGKDVES